MKSLRLIIGVMVLLPVWSQTVPESISNEILEELKRVEDWEVELTRAGRLAAQRDFAAAGAAYQALAQAAAKFQFPLPLQAKCLNNFAAMLHVAGRYPEAEEKYRAAAEAWKLGSGPDSEHLATTLNNLGDIYRLQGKLEKAHASLEESIRIGMAARDKQKLQLAASWNNLGTVQRDEGAATPARLADARASFEKAVALKREALGPAHPDVVHSMSNLAVAIQDMGDLPAAEKLYLESIGLMEGNPDTKRSTLANAWNNLGTLYWRTERPDEAKKLFVRAENAWEQAEGPNYYLVASALNNRAELLQSEGDMAAAEPLFRRAMQITETHYGADHPQAAVSWTNLGTLFLLQGKYTGAEAFFRRSWDTRRRALGKSHPNTIESLHQVSQSLIAQRRFTEAERLLVEQLTLLELAPGEQAEGRAIRLAELANLQFLQQRYDAGERYVAELTAVASHLGPKSRRQVTEIVTSFTRRLREQKRPREAARLEGLTRSSMAH